MTALAQVRSSLARRARTFAARRGRARNGEQGVFDEIPSHLTSPGDTSESAEADNKWHRETGLEGRSPDDRRRSSFAASRKAESHLNGPDWTPGPFALVSRGARVHFRRVSSSAYCE